MDILQPLLAVLAIWLVAQYVVGPVVVRFAARAPEHYALPSKDWGELVSSSGSAFAAQHQALVQLGFVPVAATEVPNVSAVLYVNPDDHSAAQLRHAAKFISVSFVQEYANGVRLLVGNATLPSVYPTWSKRFSYSLPTHYDASAVFKKFQAIRSGMSLGEMLASEPARQLAAEEDYLNAELRNLVDVGFYSSKVANGRRHITLKGAFLITWKLAWPLRPIFLFIAHRRAEHAGT